ncbi:MULTISPECIES: ABC transporter permease [unclassified Serratia (in: enterobacteria)]|uniref:ABC transporter permease n=1 Tax=unclassified Serratia (in: enterobacteria) TaxID=2647522 RepID=UPI003076266C
MQTFKLALRNLLRNRRRTLSTLCAITVGAVGILLFGGYNRSIEYSLQTTFVRDTGHLQIQHKDYLLYGTANPAEYSIKNYHKIMAQIEQDPELSQMVVVKTPVLILNGIAGNYAAGTSRPVLIYGSEAAGQLALNEWDEYHLGKGMHENTLSENTPDAAMIGAGVARMLQLCGFIADRPCSSPPSPVENHSAALPDDLLQLAQQTREERKPPTGDQIELLAASVGGAPNIIRVQVEAVQPQAARELDDSYVGIHLAQAQQLVFGRDRPGVTAITLQLRNTEQLEAARARLQQLFKTTLADEPLAVYDFSQLQPLYNQILDMFGKIFHFLLALILCIALFTVSNTMSMAVLERTIEIGTLRAVGLKRQDIQRLFLNEGILLGMLGCLTGILLSLFLAYLINRSGLTWHPPGVIAPIPIKIRIWGEWTMLLSVLAILMVAAVSSSWWPARRAANVHIVQALRHA